MFRPSSCLPSAFNARRVELHMQPRAELRRPRGSTRSVGTPACHGGRAGAWQKCQACRSLPEFKGLFLRRRTGPKLPHVHCG
jgi:hypothetical protein